MLIEATILILTAVSGLIVVMDRISNPHGQRLFRRKPKIVTISQSFFPILLVVFLIRSFTFESFNTPSGAMKPTLLAGDLVIVDKYSHGLRVPLLGYKMLGGKPKRGDIVVFHGEEDGKSSAVMQRIVGLPGDHIKYQNRTLYINGKPATQLNIDTAFDDKTKVIRATEDLYNMQHDIFMSLKNEKIDYPFCDITVPENSYFVLGDDRTHSKDSRYFGVLPDRKLIGKARLIAFSIDWTNKKIRWNRIGRI